MIGCGCKMALNRRIMLFMSPLALEITTALGPGGLALDVAEKRMPRVQLKNSDTYPLRLM
jgi:hypothetical protein